MEFGDTDAYWDLDIRIPVAAVSDVQLRWVTIEIGMALWICASQSAVFDVTFVFSLKEIHSISALLFRAPMSLERGM